MLSYNSCDGRLSSSAILVIFDQRVNTSGCRLQGLHGWWVGLTMGWCSKGHSKLKSGISWHLILWWRPFPKSSSREKPEDARHELMPWNKSNLKQRVRVKSQNVSGIIREVFYLTSLFNFYFIRDDKLYGWELAFPAVYGGDNIWLVFLK